MSTKSRQLLWTRAVGVLAAVICYLLLPGGLSSDWRVGLSVVVGWAIVFALAWPLRLTSAELWWWPFPAPRVERRPRK